MYSTENYIWGMVAYALGVALVCPAVFKVSNFVMPWRPLRAVIKAFFLTLMLTPVQAYKDTDFLAPAWMVAVFEIIRPTSPEGPAIALALLSSVFAGLTVLTFGYYIARYVIRRRGGFSRRQPAFAAAHDRTAVADEYGDEEDQDSRWESR